MVTNVTNQNNILNEINSRIALDATFHFRMFILPYAQTSKEDNST